MKQSEAWLILAERTADKIEYPGYLCCELDDMYFDGIITSNMKYDMQTRIERDITPEEVGDDDYDTDWAGEPAYEPPVVPLSPMAQRNYRVYPSVPMTPEMVEEDKIRFDNECAEQRQWRVLAALMFYWEALWEEWEELARMNNEEMIKAGYTEESYEERLSYLVDLLYPIEEDENERLANLNVADNMDASGPL